MSGLLEKEIAHLIITTWGAHPRLRLWRANTGVGWFKDGQPARKTDRGAYPVRFGCKGQGDWSGLVDTGQRLELETKTADGRQSEEQKAFQAMIERFGGLYVLARSLEDFDAAMALLGITR